jgi:hypothetical protein
MRLTAINFNGNSSDNYKQSVDLIAYMIIDVNSHRYSCGSSCDDADYRIVKISSCKGNNNKACDLQISENCSIGFWAWLYPRNYLCEFGDVLSVLNCR